MDASLVAHERGVWATLRAYVAVTKPRIIELLLVTTIPTMLLAQNGWPPLRTVIITLIGGALAAAGANTLNSVYDRDIDMVMGRTENRPLATGAISPRAGLIYGIILSVLSVALMWSLTNWLAGVLTIAAIAFYVLGYTMLLKRRTPQNIVWGGAAGCMPVLIGWSAVTGTLTWTPVILFLIVFWWTPPHYWPLAFRYRDDYEQAGVPMLPVVAAPVHVGRQIIIYSWVMVLTSLALVPIAAMGWVYTAGAILLGGWFLFEAYALAHRLRTDSPSLRPMRLFHYSITYLALLFLFVAIEPWMP